MRNSICRSGSTAALRSTILRWMATAHSTAFSTLGNSASRPSPAVSMTRPPNSPTIGSTTAWWPLRSLTVRAFVGTHQGAVAGNIRGQDGCKPARLTTHDRLPIIGLPRVSQRPDTCKCHSCIAEVLLPRLLPHLSWRVFRGRASPGSRGYDPRQSDRDEPFDLGLEGHSIDIVREYRSRCREHRCRRRARGDGESRPRPGLRERAVEL